MKTVRSVPATTATFSLVSLLMLSAGCEEVGVTTMSRPALPSGLGKVHRCFNEGITCPCLHFKLADADLEVAAENQAYSAIAPARQTTAEVSARPQRLTIRLGVRPKGSELTLDASRIFYSADNQVQLAPYLAEGWIKKRWSFKDPVLSSRDPQPIPLKEHAYFYLDYNVEANPDVKFTISVRGLSKAGFAVPVPDIHFAPIVTRHFKVKWDPDFPFPFL